MLHHIINYVLHHHQWMALSMMHSTITILWLCQKGITLSTLHSTMQYSSNVALHIHCCNTLPMTYYTINDAFSHQHSITARNKLLYQHRIVFSTLHYIIKDALYHHWCILPPALHYSANTSLQHQCFITSSTLNYRINAALHLQCCSAPTTLHYTFNAS